MKTLFIHFFIYYSVFLLFEDNYALFMLSNIAFFMHSMLIFRKALGNNLVSILIALIIISLPISFKSISGVPFEQLPISWYMIFLSLIISVLFISASLIPKNKLAFNSVSMVAAVVLIYIFVPMLNSIDIFEGIKQVLGYTLFFVTLIFIPNINIPYKYKEYLKELYITSVLALSLVVIFQALLHRNGISIGNTLLLGGERYATGYLFSDYSFLALYLVSPIYFIFFKEIKIWIKFNMLFVILSASFLTTARTGVIAVVICMLVFLIIYSLRNAIIKTPKVMVIWIAFLVVCALLINMLSMIRSEDILSSSGRYDGYIIALRMWFDSFFLGIGFDMNSYKSILGIAMPHNFVIQLLLQGGIVYFILIVTLFFLIFVKSYSLDKNSIWTLLLIIIGSQFIPDILDSRYLLVLILLVSLKNMNKSQNKVKLKEV
ncbi:O-antigen ligase family protein [Solibacillus sp. NPDC093137]|uniref:O-antigen ligase family protein n=1 Tax=Solibacillus sp. NPDC093137 TaxID=3390678 RepID=UPI003D004A2E